MRYIVYFVSFALICAAAVYLCICAPFMFMGGVKQLGVGHGFFAIIPLLLIPYVSFALCLPLWMYCAFSDHPTMTFIASLITPISLVVVRSLTET